LQEIASEPQMLYQCASGLESVSTLTDGCQEGPPPDGSRRIGKERVAMKLSLRSKVSILALTLFAAGAFAANDSYKGGLNLSAPVQVAGQQLPAGEYVVKWDGVGPTVQVNIIRSGKVVATVPARVLRFDQKQPADAVLVGKTSNGERTLIGIQFAGKTYALEISGEAGSAEGASASNQK